MTTPRQFRNYEVVHRIGSWRAGSLLLGKGPEGEQVLIKTLEIERGADPVQLPRFLREGQIHRKLQHPNILRMLTSGVLEGRHYMVFEHHPGALALKDYLSAARGPVAIPWAIAMTRQLLEALAHAHAQGVIHRELSPRTIQVLEDERVLLSDFGVAATEDELLDTSVGQRLGDFHYSSPEQNRGQEVSQSSDLYALGLVLWEALTGLQALHGSFEKVLRLQGAALAPPSSRRSKVPGSLDGFCERLLRADPAQRYPNAKAALEALRGIEAFEIG